MTAYIPSNMSRELLATEKRERVEELIKVHRPLTPEAVVEDIEEHLSQYAWVDVLQSAHSLHKQCVRSRVRVFVDDEVREIKIDLTADTLEEARDKVIAKLLEAA